MNADPQGHPAPVPAGDVGNHALPKFLIAFAGIVASLAVATRLFARYRIRRLGIPDILLVLSMVSFIVILYNGYESAIYPGFGVHTWQLDPKLEAGSHFNFKLGTIGFGIGIAFLKVAILLDWMRIFVPTGTRNALFWILQFFIWSNAIFYFIGTFVDAFVCPPKDVGTVKCNIDVAKYIVTSGVINLISDLTILVIPHWVIWKLNMSHAQKKGISVLFLIGLLATGSALARLINVLKAMNSRDTLYYSIIINIWAIAEQTFGFLVIGIPAIPKALGDFQWAKRFGSATRSRSGRPSNPSNWERGVTWPIPPARRHRDPWDIETQALVGEEVIYIPLPDQAHIRDEHGRRNCSRDDIGKAAVTCNS